eukprot:ctg_177.g86
MGVAQAGQAAGRGRRHRVSPTAMHCHGGVGRAGGGHGGAGGDRCGVGSGPDAQGLLAGVCDGAVRRDDSVATRAVSEPTTSLAAAGHVCRECPWQRGRCSRLRGAIAPQQLLDGGGVSGRRQRHRRFDEHHIHLCGRAAARMASAVRLRVCHHLRDHHVDAGISDLRRAKVDVVKERERRGRMEALECLCAADCSDRSELFAAFFSGPVHTAKSCAGALHNVHRRTLSPPSHNVHILSANLSIRSVAPESGTLRRSAVSSIA